jgi:acetyl-CoA C-acetyltransferase
MPPGRPQVIIAGSGQTSVGELWEISLRSLAVQAMRSALTDLGGLRPQAVFVGNALAGCLSHQTHLGTLLADAAGLVGIEAAALEAGSASGGAALRQGFLAVASGLVDVALVVGVEKITDSVGAVREAALGSEMDADYESAHGLTPTSQAALITARYQQEFHLPQDGLAGFPLTAHANAARSRIAGTDQAISLADYQRGPVICPPLNMYDLARVGDGAAALVLTRPELLSPGSNRPLVRIAASASASDAPGLAERRDPLVFSAAQRSVEVALRSAGIHREQIDLFEYHDAFSIYCALSLEAAGFAGRGEGWKLAADGSIALTGQIPCATFGGLQGRGNPLGACGVYQAVEAVRQLRGLAGANQVQGARLAMIQSLAGPACLALTHILEAVEEE